MYKCCRCGYSTHIKTQYVRHLNRKNPCKPKHSNKNISELLEEINKKPKQNDTNCNFLGATWDRLIAICPPTNVDHRPSIWTQFG